MSFLFEGSVRLQQRTGGFITKSPARAGLSYLGMNTQGEWSTRLVYRSSSSATTYSKEGASRSERPIPIRKAARLRPRDGSSRSRRCDMSKMLLAIAAACTLAVGLATEANAITKAQVCERGRGAYLANGHSADWCQASVDRCKGPGLVLAVLPAPASWARVDTSEVVSMGALTRFEAAVSGKAKGRPPKRAPSTAQRQDMAWAGSTWNVGSNRHERDTTPSFGRLSQKHANGSTVPVRSFTRG
jgi:hypothetical protein